MNPLSPVAGHWLGAVYVPQSNALVSWDHLQELPLNVTYHAAVVITDSKADVTQLQQHACFFGVALVFHDRSKLICAEAKRILEFPGCVYLPRNIVAVKVAAGALCNAMARGRCVWADVLLSEPIMSDSLERARGFVLFHRLAKWHEATQELELVVK